MINLIFSLLFVEFFIHYFHGLHQFFRVFGADPVLEGVDCESFGLLLVLQPLEVESEDFVSILLLEDPVYQVAAEQLHLHLAAQRDVLVY